MFLSNGSLVTKTPISLTTGYFPYMPPMSSTAWPSAYAGIYRRQLWVYVVVEKRAKATARLPFLVYRRTELGRERVEDHPMALLLAKPNPAMSAYDLWIWTSSTRDIYGDTFWLKRRDSAGVVRELYPLHPASMTYDEDKRTWRFDNGKMVLPSIDERDLVIFRSFDPDSTVRGLSPLEPLRSTLENEWSARTATSSFWQRGARPGMALAHPGSLSEPAIERLRRQMDDVAAGADKTGVTVVLEEGMKPEKMTLTAEEAQYIETRKLNREEVCAAYDIPPPVVHILDHATFSNITEQMRSMYRDTMGGILPGYEAAIDLQIRQQEFPGEDIYAEFLMDEVLRGDFETRQEALAKANHMTIAEKRRIENLPFIEGTDRIFLNAAEQPMTAPTNDEAPAAPPFQQVGLPALVEAGVISTQDARDLLGITGPPPPVADVPAEPVPLSVVRSVMGRLAWQKTLDEVEAHALTAGLDSLDAGAISAALDAERTAGGDVASLRTRVRKLADPRSKASAKAPDRTGHEATVRKVLSAFFERQGRAVLQDDKFDTARWDAALADDLHAASVAIGSTLGKSAMRELGYKPGDYNVERTVDFLKAVAERYASNINATTKAQFAAAKADPDADPSHVFEVATSSRAEGIAKGYTTAVAGFAVLEAGRQAGEISGTEPTKTWITGPNARPSHAALDGETVALSENFSNGLAWPGDGGDVDEVAGCNCDLEINF